MNHNPATLFHIAVQYHQAGNLAPAEQHYQQVLTLAPDHADTLRLLGTLYHQRGCLTEAVIYYKKLLSLRPHNVEVRYNLGLVLEQQGHLESAIATYRHVLQIQPEFEAAYLQLGQALAQQGQLAEAIDNYKTGLKYHPRAVQLHYHCGMVYQAQEQWVAAMSHYQQALQIQPDEAMTHNNLGVIYQKQGQFIEALAHYQEALLHQPKLTEAHNNLGVILQHQGQVEEAIACFRQALHLTIIRMSELTHPETFDRLTLFLAQVLDNLGVALQRNGKTNEAAAAFEQSLQLYERPELRVKMALTLPVIYRSLSHVHEWRQRLETQLAQLQPEQIEATADTVIPNFLLAYQGFNDLEIQRNVAKMYRKTPCYKVAKSSPRPKLRIGFISKYFRSHTIGLLNRGFIAQLSRAKFEVVVLSLGQYPTDPIAQFFRQQADIYLELPDEVNQASDMIAALQLDVLYYTDIGMEPLSYALALRRLAPTQCVTWGHPVTTGLDTIDYFISSQLYETTDAAQHYHEKLIQLTGLNTYYYRPQNRSDELGMMSDELKNTQHSTLNTHHSSFIPPNTYLCPQSLFKFHPDFDPILAEILHRDPEGQLVILSGLHGGWNEHLLRRWRMVMPDVINRVYFSPRLSQAEFIQQLAQATVILDTLHFCGGNTSLEALAVGTPIVTMPSPYLRGRLTYGFYRKMGMLDLVATTPTQYVNLAVRLGTDPTYRADMKAQILARNHCLYEDMTSVHELEAFFSSCQRVSQSPSQRKI